MNKIKISQLPESTSFTGLYVLATDNNNKSVKVSLEIVGDVIIHDPTDDELEEIEPSIVANALRKNEQLLTEDEQAQVLKNLGSPEVKLFIDIWNDLWGEAGGHDPENAPDAEHVFRGNDIYMTYQEAVYLVNHGVLEAPYYKSLHNSKLRTNAVVGESEGGVDLSYKCNNLQKMEVLALAPKDTSVVYVEKANYFMASAPLLKRIVGIIDLQAASVTNTMFYGSTPLLKDIKLKRLHTNINLSKMPKLSYESVLYILSNSTATAAITITVHADVYAKLTGDLTNAAAAAVSPEEMNLWTQLPALAASKNIQFVLS